MSARRLPPYGRELREWLAADPRPWRWGCNGKTACISIGIGSRAWEWARAWHERRLVLIVPNGVAPSTFDWRLCAGCGPILIARCGEVAEGEIDRVARAMMRDGVRRVLELGTMDEFFAEEVPRAA